MHVCAYAYGVCVCLAGAGQGVGWVGNGCVTVTCDGLTILGNYVSMGVARKFRAVIRGG